MNNIELIKQEFPKSFRLRFEELGGGEGCVEHPIYGGKPTHCRSTLWTLVKILKPTSILEIGSWRYDGSNMMARSLDENFGENYECDVHTFDIIKGGYNEDSASLNTLHRRVKPFFWLPHHTSYDSWKYSNPRIVHPEFQWMSNEDIFRTNYATLSEIAPAEGYDMIMIDGDHSYEGVQYDWDYAKQFISPNGIIIIDDLYDSRHHQVRKFWDELVRDKYDFSDWNTQYPDKLVSMGVV